MLQKVFNMINIAVIFPQIVQATAKLMLDKNFQQLFIFYYRKKLYIN